jgi:hypothetical protein
VKVRISNLPDNACFRQRGRVKKKLVEGRAASIRANGRVNIRKLKGDPEVEHVPCPLRYLGVGLRRHPEQVVEIGDGNILKPGRRKR